MSEPTSSCSVLPVAVTSLGWDRLAGEQVDKAMALPIANEHGELGGLSIASLSGGMSGRLLATGDAVALFFPNELGIQGGLGIIVLMVGMPWMLALTSSVDELCEPCWLSGETEGDDDARDEMLRGGAPGCYRYTLMKP